MFEFFYLGVAGANDLPHSRQDDLDREVINPQKGHILWDAKPRTGGPSDSTRFATDTLSEAQRRRKRSFHRLKSESIAMPLETYVVTGPATW